MNFEWDESKNQINISKHGLDFLDSWEVFDQPMLRKLDARQEYGEERFLGFGMLHKEIVTIVFTERDDTIRVISLRKARRDERHYYKETIKNRLGPTSRHG
jgi:uncharacterized DUF497 family protein